MVALLEKNYNDWIVLSSQYSWGCKNAGCFAPNCLSLSSVKLANSSS